MNGRAAPQNAEKVTRHEPEPAQIQFIFTVKLNVQEIALKPNHATLKTARFMADGVNMKPGQSALRPVEKDFSLEPDPAQILLLFTVELNVQETALRLSHATLKTARFMADGVNMEPGQCALRPVDQEPKHEPEPARNLFLLTVETNV